MSDMAWNLNGRVCLVTGASSGIGKETAIALARMGATVVGVCRAGKKGEQALADIRAASGNQTVTMLHGDLSLQADVRRVATEFRARHDKLHVLLNNAGSSYPRRELNEDGIEKTFALNHMGYFLLTDLLLDLVVASQPARIVNVASEGHRRGAIHLDDFSIPRGWNMLAAYGQSKLANIMFTFELSRRLEGKGVTVNCLHPGVVRTSIWGANDSLVTRILGALAWPFMIDATTSARALVKLCADPGLDGVTGKYFLREKIARSSRASCDVDVQRRLWAASEALIRPVEGERKGAA